MYELAHHLKLMRSCSLKQYYLCVYCTVYLDTTVLANAQWTPVEFSLFPKIKNPAWIKGCLTRSRKETFRTYYQIGRSAGSAVLLCKGTISKETVFECTLITKQSQAQNFLIPPYTLWHPSVIFSPFHVSTLLCCSPMLTDMLQVQPYFFPA